MYLLNYRNSPVSNLEFSPSQLFNNRHLRSRIISLKEDLLKPSVLPHSAYENMLENLKKQKLYYDKTAVKNKEVCKTRDNVWVQDTFFKKNM